MMTTKSGDILVPEDTKLGPAMRNLNVKQRAFVIAMMESGGLNHTEAAIRAGYTTHPGTARVTAHRLAHDDNILAAIQEEANRRMRSGAILAVKVLLEIVDDQGAKHTDRLKAVEMLLNRSGLHAVTEQTIKVEHRDMTEDAMIRKITVLAEKQGLDPKKLLGSAVVLDGQFTEVTDNTDIGDIL
jgi:phage terminase small subunit